ncbi:MAG: CDP-alcohol phosphatidyltransferase family protein [Lachnospiraceae bacterium]|nr:CDP-alcohol phosphatidyltransferase family protein [Lachnospiraceae bacterium]MEE0959458.1 CDP-alcohol phosphatidyltransferase family protein [Lachnospiraceae bacterium]
MIGFYNYTVVLTYAGFVSAVMGICMAASGNPVISIICLLFSGFCDMFDGKVARTKKDRTDAEKKFGIQIDSLSDLVCFGVLPAMVGYAIGMRRPIQILVLCVYVLNALIRLAYYNVTEEERQANTSEVREYYEGLPVTASALIIPLLFCLRIYFIHFTLAYTIVLGMIAIAFISPIKIRKPDMKMMKIMVAVGIGAVVFIIKTIMRQKGI